MRKRLIAFAVAAMMMTSVAYAAPYTQQDKTADALNHLGLFLGIGTADGSYYGLDKTLNREAGTVLLIRMLGQEQTALSGGDFGMPFRDVADWSKGYIGYGWKSKIVNGVEATKFSPYTNMTDYMFLTLTLRALGYSDAAENPQFVWNDPYTLAKQVGLIQHDNKDIFFTRGDTITIFWNALSAKLAGKHTTLAQDLIQRGIFTAEEYAQAQDIQQNGRTENQGKPIQPEGSNRVYTFEEFIALSPEEQMAYYESFPSDEAYQAWYEQAKAEYDASLEGEGSDEPEGSTGPAVTFTYEEFMSLSPEEQMAYYQSFPSDEAYQAWYTQAKAEHDASLENGSSDTPEGGMGPAVTYTFEEFLALSPEEQMAYYESFPSDEAYQTWYEQAKAEYDQKA